MNNPIVAVFGLSGGELLIVLAALFVGGVVLIALATLVVATVLRLLSNRAKASQNR
jgi:hypothetical protein